jgi:hypothetical protein
MNNAPTTASLEEPHQPPQGSLAWTLEHFAEQLIEPMAKNAGPWELYQNSRKVAGFEEAKKAWTITFREFVHRRHLKRLESLENRSFEEAAEMFFFLLRLRLDPSDTLKKFAGLVTLAAQNGDVDFFKRTASEMRNAARNRPGRGAVEIGIMLYWMPCCLWLASDFAASTYLQQLLGTVTETAYSKARERLEKLGLVGYKIAHKSPLITSCTKQKALICRKGWTNLVPDSSR